MNKSKRHFIKAKEVREVFRKAVGTLVKIDETVFNKGVEVVQIAPQNKVYLIKGEPMFIEVEKEIFPALVNKEIIEKLPILTVDKGAVSHLCNGADLMAPGISKIIGEFKTGEVVAVTDEVYSKPIALVKTLYCSKEISGKSRGKVAKNIHYVSDTFWKFFKQMK